MKKRLLSFALSLVLALSLFPAQMVFAGNAAQPINTTYNTMEGAESSGSLFHNAYVRNANITAAHPNGTAQNLDVVLNLKGIAGTSQIFAVVMSAADYKTLVADKGGPTKVEGGLGNSTYHSLKVSDASRYAMGRADATDTVDNQKWVIRLITPDSKNDFDTTVGKTVMGYKTMPKAGVGSSGGSHYYYDEYVLIVFGQGQFQTNEQYYISRFYLDSDGYVRTPSYMLKYDTNDPVGTSAPNWNGRTQIQRAAWSDSDLAGTDPGTVTLKAANENPTCIGYKFIGWTTDKRDPLAEGAPEPTDSNFYKAGAVFPKQTDYTVTTIYALWQTVPVKFSHTDGAKYTVVNEGTEEAPNWVMEWKTAPQVGVTLNSDPIAYAQPADSNSQPYGNKTFVVKTYQGSTELSTANPYNNITVGRLGAAGAQYQWGFIANGGPNNHTYKEDGTAEDYRMVITVTDPSNNTSDTITVRFPKIEKRAQNAPDPDVNTGLEGAVDTLTGTDNQKLPQAVEDAKLAELNTDGGSHTVAELYDFKDGKLTGFYSVGQKLYQDVGGNKMNDGTGSLRDYYLKNGMIYEYRPYKEGTGADEGWREVPYPGNYYSGANKTTVEAAMGYRTDKTAYTKAKFVTNVNQAGITSVTAGTQTDPWPAEYGWIVWENNLPVVHGLTEGAVYEVRFRSNTTSSASAPIQVAVVAGGALVGGGETGGGGGLAVNLSGGDEPKDDAKTVYDKFVSDAAALKPGDTLAIPDFTPTRENYSFAGWTLGERDENGQLILYRAGDTGGGEEPPAPETVTVIWLNDDGTEITRATFPGGTTEYPFPETATAPSKEGHTLSWSAPVTNDDGSITITAEYTAEEPEARDGEGAEPTPGRTVTVTWVDPLKDGEDKTVKTAEGVELTPEGDLPDTVTHPEPPTHEGKTFEKWEKAVDAETGNVTYTAVYKDAEPAPPPTQTVRDTVTMPQTGPASLAAVWEGGGPPDPSDFTAIVFYDWDETYLGSAVIAKTATAEDIQKVLNEFSASKYSNYVADMSFPADLSTESWVNDSAYPLTYKKGYNFAGWVEVNGEGTPTLADAFTAYPAMGEPDEEGNYPANTFNGDKWNIPSPPEGGWSGITLKAGYVENAFCNQGDGLIYYSTSQSMYGRPGTAAAGNYSITYTVARENLAGNGVTRLRSPALRVTMAAGSVQFSILQSISNIDKTEVEVIVPSNLTTVTIALVDASEGSWLGAGIKAVDKAETSATYIREGSITYINEAGIAAAKTPAGEALPTEWTLNVDFATANNAGFTTATGGAFTARNFNAAKTKLLAAYQSFVADPNNVGKVMTAEEIQTGLNTGTWTPSGS